MKKHNKKIILKPNNYFILKQSFTKQQYETVETMIRFSFIVGGIIGILIMYIIKN